MTDIEICKLAYELELEMNPYCGYQDPYGCGIGGFKRIDFERGGIVRYDFLSTELFNFYDMHLVFTGVTRNSKGVLKSVTDNLRKIRPLLKTVDQAYDALLDDEYDKFLHLLKKSWTQKKATTSAVTENETIREMDNILEDNESVVAHKLCGAGNGGFFLVFSETNSLKIPYQSVKIEVSPNGVMGRCL
jgi:D-glycero-alpha-D-manno-heptose-7-phosphate kinase